MSWAWEMTDRAGTTVAAVSPRRAVIQRNLNGASTAALVMDAAQAQEATHGPPGARLAHPERRGDQGPSLAHSDQRPSNRAVLFTRDNGSGKTQVVARFPTGAVQVLATEP